MSVYACIKWITPHSADDRFGGMSPADRSALELAIRLGSVIDEPVIAVSLGPSAADAALREALACGAHRAVRIDVTDQPDSAAVARAMAAVLSEASFVCCGDYSLDRGSGSVPAFLAAELGVRQALGLIAVDPDGATFEAVRRLDGGRRERLRISAPAVLSVEGATLALRRASLRASLAAEDAPIEIVSGPRTTPAPTTVRAYRPRPRVLEAPAGNTTLERVRSIVSTGSASSGHGETVELEPDAAADRIISALRDWGYIE